MESDAYQLAPFNVHRLSAGRLLLTNDVYDFAFLPEGCFETLVAGGSLPSEIHEQLLAANLIVNGEPDEVFVERLRGRMRRAKEPTLTSTTLFIFVMTLECGLRCCYCQAAKDRDADRATLMSLETAKRCADRVLESPAGKMSVEFQGGEPLLNFRLIREVVQYFRRKEREQGTENRISFQVTTSFHCMNDEIAEFLVEEDFAVCVSCDGPKELHDANRPRASGKSSFEDVVQWTAALNERWASRGSDRRVNALPTITRASLKAPVEIVDTYVSLGFDSLFVRPLSPFGRASGSKEYSVDEFVMFYEVVFNRVVEHCRDGQQIREGYAELLFQKLFAHECANHMEFRSPCGAGIGQMAFDWDGEVYTCDEGRMMAQEGDTTFRMGNSGTESYTDLLRSDIVQLTTIASCAESHPDCSICAFQPFCGLCAVFNMKTQESLFGDMTASEHCATRMAMFEFLFRFLDQASPRDLDVLRSWVSVEGA